MDVLRQYSSPPTNYIGTAIFLSYIFAALYFVSDTLWSLSKQMPFRRNNRNRGIPVLLASRIAFAILTFALLSYNMLSFLIESYKHWIAENMAFPDSVSHLHLGKWMLQSCLFDDFAHDLVGNGQDWTAIWTILSLLWTGAINVWMALAGRQNRMIGLWKYFVLAQILPVSFTHCLFSIAVTIGSFPAMIKDEDTNVKTQPSRVSVLESLTPSETATILILTGAMMAMTSVLLKSTDSEYFLAMVLLIRAVLFAPYLFTLQPAAAVKEKAGSQRIDQPALSSRTVRIFVGTVTAMTALLIGSAVKHIPADQYTMKAAWQGLNQNWAVRALGYDFLLGLCS